MAFDCLLSEGILLLNASSGSKMQDSAPQQNLPSTNTVKASHFLFSLPHAVSGPLSLVRIKDCTSGFVDMPHSWASGLHTGNPSPLLESQSRLSQLSADPGLPRPEPGRRVERSPLSTQRLWL